MYADPVDIDLARHLAVVADNERMDALEEAAAQDCRAAFMAGAQRFDADVGRAILEELGDDDAADTLLAAVAFALTADPKNDSEVQFLRTIRSQVVDAFEALYLKGRIHEHLRGAL